MVRLIAAYITESDQELIELSISAIHDHVDHIYVIWSKTDGDDTPNRLINKFGVGKITIFPRQYEHNFLGANGRQRNEYLKAIKEKETEPCWVLVLDSDEVVDDLGKLRQWIDNGGYQQYVENTKKMQPHISNVKMFSVKMRHLIRSLQHEDSTYPDHWCPNRLFYWTPQDNYFYDEVEHPILARKIEDNQIERYAGRCDIITIWHLAYAKHTLDIRKKFLNHSKKSNIHSPEYLQQWYRAHLFDAYPRKQFNPAELPDAILKYFMLENLRDELYFQNRGLEVKHFMDACNWKNYFGSETTLEIGCGLGHRVSAMHTYGMLAFGLEISKWAVENCPYQEIKHLIMQGDITDPEHEKTKAQYGLVIAYDLLEHIPEEKIHETLRNIAAYGYKHFLFSIPFEGDPNLYHDPTHKTFKPKSWWIEQIEKAGIIIVDTPSHFLYKEQLIIGIKK